MRRSKLARLAALAALPLTAACSTTSTPPPAELLLEPLTPAPARAPEVTDLLAVAVAEASLAGDRPAAEDWLHNLEAELKREADDRHSSERARRADAPNPPEILEQQTGRSALLPLAIDLANAAGNDPRRYREESRALLRRDDVDPAHRARLEQAVADDPLALAERRVREGYESVFAQTFNTVSAPLGRSLLTGYTTAPFEIAMSVTHYLAGMSERPAVGVRERQALRHWDDFLARYPDAPEAAAVRERADATRQELASMQTDRFVRASTEALAHGQPGLARLHARHAQHYTSDDERVDPLLERIERRERERDAARNAALEARAKLDAPDEPALLVAVWLAPPAALAAELRRAIAHDPHGPLADEFSYALATTQIEQGAEDASWERLRDIARAGPEGSNMARHADALLYNPWQNPEGAFHRELTHGRERAVSDEVFGRYAHGPRYREMPETLAYLIDAPAIAQHAISTPFRLLLSPFQDTPKRDHMRGAAIASYRYLERFPGGEHTRERAQWLFDYEKGRGNALAALRLADLLPDFDPVERAELAEQAADQQLASAIRAGRRDHRAQMLRGVALAFPDSMAGRDAGNIARREVEEATPQRIRLTREFLRENPQIAGPHGLALDPILVDGDLFNGELHPYGVTFLGGRVLEIALVAPDGDEDAKPELVRTTVAAERLARSVALVEEAATLGVRLDRDDTHEVDGSRDHYFDRARLELTDEIDSRATAESTYVYQGMTERYGLVRGRESILPFDIVVQGSVTELGLGAFPRWREPPLTPDAFLYH